MKKTLLIFLVAITLLSVLLGCSDNAPDTPKVTTEMPDTTSPDTTADTTEAVTDETTAPPDDDITYVIDQEKGVLYEGDTVIHTLAQTSDSETLNRVSKDSFTEPIKFDYNGKKITVEPPVFTGLSVDSVWSYKDSYYFYDGSTIFDISCNGYFFVKVNKDGKIISADSNFSRINEGRTVTRYIPVLTPTQVELEDGLTGMVRGDGSMRVMVGEPGNYTTYLYSASTGERLSNGYDYITYFYNGLALVGKDYKIGIIDDKGNELLAPCIEYDTLTYPPTGREYYVVQIFEDAFVLPIGGELAIINISRGN